MPRFEWPMPSWLTDLPPDEQASRTNCFRLALATIYLEHRASASDLSRRLGKDDPNYVNVLKSRGSKISPEDAIALEGLLGRDLFPREFFRPDIFTLPE